MESLFTIAPNSEIYYAAMILYPLLMRFVGQRFMPRSVLDKMQFVSTFFHELLHYIPAVMLLGFPVRMSFKPSHIDGENTVAMVTFRSPIGGAFGNTIIAAGPMVVGLAVAYWVAVVQFSMPQPIWNAIGLFVIYNIGVNVAMSTSQGDMNLMILPVLGAAAMVKFFSLVFGILAITFILLGFFVFDLPQDVGFFKGLLAPSHATP